MQFDIDQLFELNNKENKTIYTNVQCLYSPNIANIYIKFDIHGNYN